MLRLFLLLLPCLVLLNACRGTDPEVIRELHKPIKGYALGPEDVLDVTVWKNEALSKVVTVRPDGMISLPLIGDVKASGLTADELSQKIAERLKEYKDSPQVSVAVKEVNSYFIYIVGEVAKPGKLPLKSHATVLQAIALAGGFTQYASKNSMSLVRMSQNGDGTVHELRVPLKYDDLMSGKGEVGNPIMRSGDTLVVPMGW